MDGLLGCVEPASPPQVREADRVGELVEGSPFPVELAGDGPVALSRLGGGLGSVEVEAEDLGEILLACHALRARVRRGFLRRRWVRFLACSLCSLRR